MARRPDISLRRHAKQPRALATVAAVAEAAAYILKRDGPGGFTTNRVAEKAGVNIASLYQYFPNKEALLFHIVETTWDRQLAALTPLLSPAGGGHADRLRAFVRRLFAIEAEEADLRSALRAASVDIRDTEAFRALMRTGGDLVRGFLRGALGGRPAEGLEFEVDFVVLLLTGVAERTTDARTAGKDLLRQADLLSDMLIAHFRIA